MNQEPLSVPAMLDLEEKCINLACKTVLLCSPGHSTTRHEQVDRYKAWFKDSACNGGELEDDELEGDDDEHDYMNDNYGFADDSPDVAPSSLHDLQFLTFRCLLRFHALLPSPFVPTPTPL